MSSGRGDARHGAAALSETRVRRMVCSRSREHDLEQVGIVVPPLRSAVIGSQSFDGRCAGALACGG